LVHAFDFGASDDVKHLFQSEYDLIDGSLDGDAAIRTLGRAVLVDLNVGARGFAYLFDLEAGSSDNTADDRLVNQKPQFLRAVHAAFGAGSALNGLLGHEGHSLFENAGDLVGRVRLNRHDTFGSGTIGNSNVGIVIGSQLLNVHPTLADNTTGDLTGDQDAYFELIAAGPFGPWAT